MKNISAFCCVLLAVCVMVSITDKYRAKNLTEACRKQGGMLVDNTCVKEHHYGHEASETGPRK